MVSTVRCAQECGLPGALADGGERDAIVSAGGAEVPNEVEDEAVGLSASATTGAGPAVLALFALMALGLLVGLIGGLRSFRGRTEGG